MALKHYFLMLFSLSITNCVFGQEKREPICSRFHYEEMLLEKMIRLEHSTNLMMEEFRSIQTKVDNNLAAVSQATENMKSSVEHALETAEQATEQMREKIKEEIQTNKEVMTTIEGGLQKSTYAFSVYWLADTSLISGNVVIFTRKPLDEGALYDTNTGKYNVPVSGLYFFTSGLCVNKGDYGAINIVADGTRIGAFDAVDYDLHTCSTGSALAKLEKNTKVWLVVTADTSARNTDTYGGFNYFSGYLISEQH